MPTTGQTIVNSFSGETITFVRTAADTDGAAVELLFEVTPGGAPPAAHVHPIQTETFEIHEGRCRVELDGVVHEAGPGDVLVAAPGVAHMWAAETDVRMTVTLEPALEADRFFEELVAIVDAGHIDAKGLPTPLYLAVLADDHRGLVYLAAASVWLQRTAFAVLGRIGRALGRTAPAAAARATAPAPTPA
jgi:quercetin dioxygenase-like cupin family protein